MFSRMLSTINGKPGSEESKPSNSSIPVAQTRSTVPTVAKSAVNIGSRIYEISEKERKEQREKVARLKAEREKLRLLEIEKKAAARSATRSSSSRSPSVRSSTFKPTTPRSMTSTNKNRPKHTLKDTYIEPERSAPKKKLNFKDIMSHAEKIDNEKMKLSIKVKDSKSVRVSSESKNGSPKPEKSEESSRGTKPAPSVGPKTFLASNKPTAIAVGKPMPKLLEKQRKRKEMENRQRHARQEENEEFDDFIVSDEEKESHMSNDVGYDRDEIWGIFNRGKKRQNFYDDSDDSDMEARGAEIFAEETRSSLAARREDAEEERRLHELAAMKRSRKQKS